MSVLDPPNHAPTCPHCNTAMRKREGHWHCLNPWCDDGVSEA